MQAAVFDDSASQRSSGGSASPSGSLKRGAEAGYQRRIKELEGQVPPPPPHPFFPAPFCIVLSKAMGTWCSLQIPWSVLLEMRIIGCHIGWHEDKARAASCSVRMHCNSCGGNASRRITS